MTKIQRGAVLRTAGAYDRIITGTIQAGFPAQAIHQQQQPCLEVLVQNDPDSAVNVFVGNEFGQYMKLVPGASITIPVNDVSAVWTGTAGGAATVNWMAMR